MPSSPILHGDLPIQKTELANMPALCQLTQKKQRALWKLPTILRWRMSLWMRLTSTVWTVSMVALTCEFKAHSERLQHWQWWFDMLLWGEISTSYQITICIFLLLLSSNAIWTCYVKIFILVWDCEHLRMVFITPATFCLLRLSTWKCLLFPHNAMTLFYVPVVPSLLSLFLSIGA